MDRLIELAERAVEKPPFFSACRWGFHRMAKVQHWITCGTSVCLKCGIMSAESLFGDFEYSRQESSKRLHDLARARARSER